MLEIYVIFFTFLITIILNLFSKKKQFLVDKKFSPHKSFATENLIPITGGLIFFISCLFFLSFDNQSTKFLLLLIFIVGLLSDSNYLFSPIKRFFFQILSVIIFVYANQLFIDSIRITTIDNLLDNVYFKYFFTLFCLLILINGANFIDGVNTLLLGYFLTLSIICVIGVEKFDIPFDVKNFKIIIIILSIILIFNFFGKLLTGDGGAYLISFIIGYFLIDLVNSSERVSPYFVACLLWYPAYECFFSIIRKKITKKSVADPDNKHLHQLIFAYLMKNLKFKGNFLNTFTGLSINFYNTIIFYFAFHNISQTKNLIFLIILSLLLYNFTYLYLRKNLKN